MIKNPKIKLKAMRKNIFLWFFRQNLSSEMPQSKEKSKWKGTVQQSELLGEVTFCPLLSLSDVFNIYLYEESIDFPKTKRVFAIVENNNRAENDSSQNTNKI